MRRSPYRSTRAVPQLRALLASRLRDVRRARRLSQVEVASRSGLSRKFIGEVERAEKSPSIDSLHRVASVLRVPLRELLADPTRRNGRVPTPIEDICRLLARRSGRELRPAQEAIAAMLGRTRMRGRRPSRPRTG